MRRLTLYTITILVALGLSLSAAAGNGDRFLDVIVKLDVDTAAMPGQQGRDMAAAVAGEYGVQARHTYGTVFSGFSARVPEAVFNQMKNDPLIATIDFDAPVYIAGGNCPHCGGGGDDDGGGSNQTVPWGISRVGAPTNNTGAGVAVYVIDTGIDPNHRDLNVVGGFASEGCKGRCAASWDDDHGHGTHVAGTTGALDNDVDVVGVAPGVDLYAVKVLSNSGSGSRAGVIAGIDWVAQQAINKGEAVVANMSLGGSGSKSGSCTNSGFTGTDTYHEALCNARNVGVVFVVAAGNSGADSDGAVPAAYDDAVITVSATNANDDWTSWSNWGNRSANWTSNNSAPVAIAAPGASILSTSAGGGTETMSGTSMSSPHVAGGAALVMSSSNQPNDGRAFENVRSALLNAAESTNSFSNTSGNPHDEDFLDVRGL